MQTQGFLLTVGSLHNCGRRAGSWVLTPCSLWATAPLTLGEIQKSLSCSGPVSTPSVLVHTLSLIRPCLLSVPRAVECPVDGCYPHFLENTAGSPEAIVPVFPYKPEAGQAAAWDSLSLHSPRKWEWRDVWNTWAGDKSFILLAQPVPSLGSV